MVAKLPWSRKTSAPTSESAKKEPGVVVRPVLWRFAAEAGRATGSKTQGNTAEGPPRRPGKIDPAKGHFRSRLPAPRPSGSYAAGKSVRPAKAKSAGFRSETSTAFSSARGEDLPDMRVSAGGSAGAEILDTLETGTMANTNTIICMLQSLFCNKNGKYLGEPRKRGSKIGADRRAYRSEKVVWNAVKLCLSAPLRIGLYLLTSTIVVEYLKIKSRMD